jgi:hypothetical protein
MFACTEERHIGVTFYRESEVVLWRIHPTVHRPLRWVEGHVGEFVLDCVERGIELCTSRSSGPSLAVSLLSPKPVSAHASLAVASRAWAAGAADAGGRGTVGPASECSGTCGRSTAMSRFAGTTRAKLALARPRSAVARPRTRSHAGIADRAGGGYTRKHIMSTSVHIPKPLLEAVDRRARALQVSRNRFIVKALEREVSGGPGWSPGFFERLSDVDKATVAAADEMVVTIRAARRSKEPRRL